MATPYSQPPKKRQRKSPSPSTSSSQTPKQSLRMIQTLESDLSAALTASSSLNALVDLHAVASSAKLPEVVSKAIYALYRIYTQVSAKGLLVKAKGSGTGEGASDKEAEERNVVRSWLLTNLNSFRDFLGGLLKDEEHHLRASALQILFTILKMLSTRPSVETVDPSSSTQSTSFDGPFFHKIVLALLACPSSPRHVDESEQELQSGLIDTDVCDMFVRTWLNKYDDIRWFFLREVITILSTPSLLTTYPLIPANTLSILEKIDNMPSKDSDIASFWLEGFSRSPKSNSSKTKASSKASGNESASDSESDEEEDDWRTYFDDPQPPTSAAPSTRRKRVHKMSVAEQIRSLAAHRAVFTRCWLMLLPLLSSPAYLADNSASLKNQAKQTRKGTISDSMVPDALSLTTRALTVLHRGVMPHLTRAVLVMDWVAGCVDEGGVVGMLALNALFILMKDYNLDYPQFYTRLYAFLDRDVLHAKYRARFFRLLELFLGSTHLPATLLASFLKRLARLSLSAPPAAIVIVIPFTYNTLKRHPALMVMIHNPETKTGDELDPFLPAATSPQHTNALQSSLWEIYTHTQHYHHAVSTLAKIFEGAFTKPAYGMEDFLDHSYASLFETESSRKIKQTLSVPVVEPEVAKLRKMKIRHSFSDSAEDEDAEIGVDLFSTLWRF